jgi:hypothetical protein
MDKDGGDAGRIARAGVLARAAWRTDMRPFGIDETELLRQARARARELEADFRMANTRPVRRVEKETPSVERGGIVRHARMSAGRGLMGLGARVMPEQSEPCS